MTAWAAVLVLFVVVALVAFRAGRAARQVDQLHGDALGRALHPSTARASIDQPSGEHVRVIAPPYDWDTPDQQQGADDGPGRS